MAYLNISAFLNLNGSGFALGIKRAESTAKQFAREFKNQMAAAFGIGAVVAFSKKLIDTADNLLDLEKRLGVNSDTLQEWEYAAKKSGASLDDVVSFFENIAKARERALGGSEDDIAALQKLGITAKGLMGRNEQIGLTVGNAIKNGDIQSLLPSLLKVGGKGSANLITAFKEGLDDAAEAAHDAGQVLSYDTLFALKQVKTEAQLLADTLRRPLADALVLATGTFKNFVNNLKAASAFWGAFDIKEFLTGKNKPKLPAFPGAPWPEGSSPETYAAEMAEYEKNKNPFTAAIAAFDKVMEDAKREEEKAFRNLHSTRDAMTSGSFDPAGFLKEEKSKLSRPDVNQLQKIGAAVLDKPVVTEAKKTNSLLKEIRDRLKNNPQDGNFGGTQF